MPFCQECGTEYEEGAAECPSCGNELTPKTKKKGFRWWYLLFLIPVVLIVLLLTCFTAVNAISKTEITIIEDENILKEDHYHYYSFKVRNEATLTITSEIVDGVPLEGYILDDTNYQRFKNSITTAKYHKRFTIKGSPSTNKYVLRPGDYYLVVENMDYGKIIPPMNFADDIVKYRVKVDRKKN